MQLGSERQGKRQRDSWEAATAVKIGSDGGLDQHKRRGQGEEETEQKDFKEEESMGLGS